MAEATSETAAEEHPPGSPLDHGVIYGYMINTIPDYWANQCSSTHN